MALSIKTLTALAALVVALPGASAVAATAGAPLTPSPQGAATAVVDDAAAQLTGVVGSLGSTANGVIAAATDGADGATGKAGDLLQPLKNALDCRAAVQVHLDWYGGRITDTRSGAGDFFVANSITSTVTKQVPHYETVTETVWSAGGLLDSVLSPITQTVTRLTGYDLQSITTTTPADLAVAASWKEDYVAWTAYHNDWYVSPLAALQVPGLIADPLELVCDKNAQIHNEVPTPWNADVDLYCVCYDAPADGWYIHILSLQLRLANASEYKAAWSGNLIIAPQDIADAALAKAKLLDFTPSQLTQQSLDRATAGRPDAPTQASAPDVTTKSGPCSVLNVPLGTGAVLGLLGAGILSMVGLAGRRMVRRKM